VWTCRGLVTYYTVFVIELHSRRFEILGCTPHPDEAFMVQIARHLTDGVDGVLAGRRFLICDHDQKWSPTFLQVLGTAGVRVVRIPVRARIATRTRSALFGPSKKNALTASSRWVSGTSVERSRSS
jgi:hypothetical protein